MTRIEQLELIKEVIERLDKVAGDTIDERISNALHNINVDIEIEKYPDLKLTEEDLIIYSNIQKEIDNIFKLVYTFTLADILNDIEKNFKKNPTTEIKLINIEDGKLKINAYINWRITYER